MDWKAEIDIFEYAPTDKERMRVQELVQKRFNIDDLKSLEGSNAQKANMVAAWYSYTAFEAGVVSGLKSIKKDLKVSGSSIKIKIKRSLKDKFAYRLSEEMNHDIAKTVLARVNSDYHKAQREKYCQDNNIDNEYEHFIMAMVLNTAFEYGMVYALNDVDFLINVMAEGAVNDTTRSN